VNTESPSATPLSWHGGAAAKRYFEGTHRIRSPAETLARLRPLLPLLGITRVANLTGLDRIGIPVAMACRPNSRSVSMFQGKGLTLDAAKVSAIMEALEVWHAERILKPLKWASRDEMSRLHRVVALEQLPRVSGAPLDEGMPLTWIEGSDLQGSGSVWVPYEVVNMNFTLPLAALGGVFQSNSSGLGSGNHELEAVCHGLCEAIERDARTLWERDSPARRAACMVDPDTVRDDACLALLSRFAAAGIAVTIWDATSDIGVPTFVAMLWDEADDQSEPELGSGCHPARHIALLRALTEAAQARTTFIAGAREDFFPDHYRPQARAERRAAMLRLASAPGKRRDYAQTPDFRAETVEDDVRRVLVMLRAAGLQEAVAVDLTQAPIGIPVVKVIVPGLEGATSYEDTGYFPGARAKRMTVQ
jgi:ribosomal protein S12 methylthiotransferase accessory factor